RLGKTSHEVMTLSVNTESSKKVFTFEYCRPLNRRNVPRIFEFQRLILHDAPRKNVQALDFSQPPGSPLFTTVHLVDKID
ncbi:hypothetical protein PMAYCL1PPCAC_22032, partial [Pristionchus mayeri]